MSPRTLTPTARVEVVWAVNIEDSDGFTYSATITCAVFTEREDARSAAAKLVRAIRAGDRARWGRLPYHPRTLHSGRKTDARHWVTVEQMPLNPEEIKP